MPLTTLPNWRTVSRSDAEAVCRHYLSNGRRARPILAGRRRRATRRAAPCLSGCIGPESGKGAAGKWTDAATGEHGDLLDLIRQVAASPNSTTSSTKPAVSLACRGRSRNLTKRACARSHRPRRLAGSGTAAIRHVAADRAAPSPKPICADAASRLCTEPAALRFHPRCYYRPDEHAPTETWPAMIAAVTDLARHITGVHRTWLDPGGFSGRRSARRRSTRRAGRWAISSAMPSASAWRGEVMAAGEGIETMLSLRWVLPTMPMVAALSAAHLAAILLPADTAPPLYRARR